MTPPQPTEAQAVHARRALGFILMSAAVPGSVQSFAGNRGLGRIAGRVYGAAALLGVLVLLGLWLWRGPTVGVLLTPWVATIVRFALWVLFAGWVLLLLDSWRLARPLRLPRRPRLVLTITSLVLALAVGGVTTVAANALVAARNVGEVFGGGGEAEIKDGRYNVLLLGADSAADRQGLRPDSINVASVDAQTGRTVLFGLPRNLQKVRFPDSSPLNELYPDGFICEDNGCMLNGIWTLGEEHADLYPGRQAGLEAMKEAVEETLGLDLNYYALVDMHGFSALIDAMGGIRLDISKPIPIGGGGSPISGYIDPGEDVLLDGYHALWFARSRAESSDYERMVRQKCVMSAMVQQLDPATVATKFVELSEAGGDLLKTDVGTGAIADLAELALKAREQNITSVNFSPPLIVTADPDFELIRSTVDEKLSPTPTPEPTATSAAPSASGSEAAASPSAQAADDKPFTETPDLAAVCSVS
ncbi:LCP family protein [Tessaracoccus sp. MC1679]|uniref:LCP family protein n=1 Tax=Tessaracoccus sp. MC1679 TaxID=2760313 RepID=UPI0016032B9D|nr:LCP family protein [Tessaracoccus sp. MC1679]